jgi:hypothetical protein
MKREKEIVLYVEDRGLVKQKKTDPFSKSGQEASIIRSFIKKYIRPVLAVYPGK